MSKPIVLMIEERVKRRWEPTLVVGYTMAKWRRAFAEGRLNDFRLQYPDRKFRLRRYTQEPEQ